MFFFWYKPEERRAIESELRRIGRTDLIAKLYDKPMGHRYPGNAHYDEKAVGSTYDNPGVGRRGRQEKNGRSERNNRQEWNNRSEKNYRQERNGRPERNARQEKNTKGNYYAPKGFGNVGCYDEEKYLNNGRSLKEGNAPTGAGYFKGKKKKSFNPNFDNNNHKKRR